MIVVAATAAAIGGVGCKVKDPLYCRPPDKLCTDPALDFCDEHGTFPASKGIAHTCIPNPYRDGGVILDDASIDAGSLDASQQTADGAGIAIDASTPISDGGANCADDQDCASLVCDLAASRCVYESEVIYLDSNAAVATPCGTRTSPCKTTPDALNLVTSTRSVIKATGMVDGSTISARSVTFVGPATLATPLVVANGGSLVARRMSASKFQCMGSPRSRMILDRAMVADDNFSGGIYASNCELTVERTTIARSCVGISLGEDSIYFVRNNFIVQNLCDGSNRPGVFIAGTRTTGQLSFNTIANNYSDASPASGLRCDSTLPAGNTFSNNIVWGNMGTTAGTNCPSTYSIMQESSTGSGNLVMDPRFVNAASGDFHLLPASPARNAGNNVNAPAKDFDGDSRPQPAGGTVDMGADETVP